MRRQFSVERYAEVRTRYGQLDSTVIVLSSAYGFRYLSYSNRARPRAYDKAKKGQAGPAIEARRTAARGCDHQGLQSTVAARNKIMAASGDRLPHRRRHGNRLWHALVCIPGSMPRQKNYDKNGTFLKGEIQWKQKRSP